MANQCNVDVLRETGLSQPDNWKLCLQWCRYRYADSPEEYGYRFIWRWPNGNLQAARGQARIPSLMLARKLMEKAESEGWANEVAEGAESMSFN